MSKLVHTEGRILVRVERSQKNGHTFSDGTSIYIGREYNNLDHAYTSQTLGLIISGKDLPEGALILYHFNAVHPSNEVYNHSQLSGEEIASDVGIYSIPESECFLWKLPNETEWHPIGNYALALKVFKPYTGVLQNAEPTEIIDTLYLLTGEYKGLVCRTIKAAAYRLNFRNEKGVDETILRCRPNGDEKNNRESECIAIDYTLTEKVNNEEYLVGIDIKSAKYLNDDNKIANKSVIGI